MTRCVCKTLKGVQCKRDAVKNTKKCAIHAKKCTQTRTKKSGRAPKKSSEKSPVWVKSKAWESPVPHWMKGGEKIKTKPMSPQNKDVWWLQ